MNFISLEYLVLFSTIFVAYYTFSRLQIPLLLIASLVFYGWGQPVVLPLLIATSIFSSAITFALLGGRVSERKRLLAIGITVNLAVLAFFKYKFLFVQPTKIESGDSLFAMLVHLPLPIGISFYTFHCISLIGDAYKGHFADAAIRDRKRGWLDFQTRCLLYLVFFPQIIAGPIVKAHQFMPQIGTKRLGDVPFAEAAKWIIWGLFFKSFVADNLNQFTVWMAAPNFERLGSGDLVLLLLCYSFQIFADFAGYSAIALGSAALLGYRLPINFDRPYVARSFSDFWRRWHISLSSFLREYLYFPLGGNRKGPARTYLNLMITMGLGGLWHGAAVSFLIWGLMHGAALSIERMASPLAAHLPRASHVRMPLGWLYTFCVFVVVSFLWLFFKLQNFDDASRYLHLLATTKTRWFFHPQNYAVIACYALPVVLVHVLPRSVRESTSPIASGAVYGLMLFLAIFDKGHTDAFIYFQF